MINDSVYANHAGRISDDRALSRSCYLSDLSVVGPHFPLFCIGTRRNRGTAKAESLSLQSTRRMMTSGRHGSTWGPAFSCGKMPSTCQPSQIQNVSSITLVTWLGFCNLLVVGRRICAERAFALEPCALHDLYWFVSWVLSVFFGWTLRYKFSDSQVNFLTGTSRPFRKKQLKFGHLWRQEGQVPMPGGVVGSTASRSHRMSGKTGRNCWTTISGTWWRETWQIRTKEKLLWTKSTHHAPRFWSVESNFVRKLVG